MPRGESGRSDVLRRVRGWQIGEGEVLVEEAGEEGDSSEAASCDSGDAKNSAGTTGGEGGAVEKASE
jgi:hypothetical protein